MIGALAKALAGWKGYAAAAAVGGVLLGTAGVTVTRWYYRAEIAGMERDQAQQIADAQALARATEQRRWAAREGVINDAKTQAAAAAADADRARAASERLRQQVDRLRAGARDPSAAGGGQAASDIVGLLAELFGDADEAAGILAKDLDASRIAGSACQKAYESLIVAK